MAELAGKHGVVFVDLFAPDASNSTRRAEHPLTINGIHLNDEGYQQLAPITRRGPLRPGPAARPRPT